MKKVICPKCKKEIDCLTFSAKVSHYGRFDLNETYTKEHGDWEDFVLSCPECDSVLFNDDEKARIFLEGKNVESN